MHPTHDSTPERLPNLGGVVLCGGQSLRMGNDKSKLMLQGQTFLQHVFSKISSVADPVVISVRQQANDSVDLARLVEPVGVKFVTDEMPDLGPLEGLRVGLQALSTDVEWAFVSGCDAPLIQTRLITHLAGLIGDYQAVVPVNGKHIFGLTAIYRTDIHEQISNHIYRQQLRVSKLVQDLTVLFVDVKTLVPFDPDLGSLMNVNRPEDYEKLLRRFD